MPRYSAPLQVVATPEMREEILEIAERDEISQAQVIRDILTAGLAARKKRFLGPDAMQRRVHMSPTRDLATPEQKRLKAQGIRDTERVLRKIQKDRKAHQAELRRRRRQG